MWWKYQKLLEAENAHLREQNRALLAALLERDGLKAAAILRPAGPTAPPSERPKVNSYIPLNRRGLALARSIASIRKDKPDSVSKLEDKANAIQSR